MSEDSRSHDDHNENSDENQNSQNNSGDDSQDKSQNGGPLGGEGPQDPFGQMFSQMFGEGGMGAFPPGGVQGNDAGADSQGQQPDLQAMFGQLQKIFGAMAQGGFQGPVNWNLATDSAHQVLGDEDSKVTDEDHGDVAQAARLADMWLDESTSFNSPSEGAQALSRSEWIEKTLPGWQRLTEPVARHASEAVSASMEEQIPEEAQALLGQAGSFLSSLGSTMFGAQLGQAVGSMASEAFGGTDVGLPLAGRGFTLVPANVAAFGKGLEEPQSEVLLYLALREAAHVRLFHSVEWLEDHVVGLVKDFASGISIDTSAIQGQMEGIDPFDPSSLQEVLGSGLLEPSQTPEQQHALARLETTLALIAGWVDAVVTQAAQRLPSAPALREMVRRRRATGGPKEQAFAGLVGLELRPRRARDAAAVWEFIASERDAQTRDAAWSDPANLPSAEDLDDPTGYFSRRALLDATEADFDAALSAWLDGESSENSNGQDHDSSAEDEDDDQGDDEGQNRT